jgi:hypothetical protein
MQFGKHAHKFDVSRRPADCCAYCRSAATFCQLAIMPKLLKKVRQTKALPFQGNAREEKSYLQNSNAGTCLALWLSRFLYKQKAATDFTDSSDFIKALPKGGVSMALT